MRCGTALTRSEVDHDVDEENGVGKTVEGDPARAEVVVEERDSHGQDDQVCHEEQQHAKVPVKPVEHYEHNDVHSVKIAGMQVKDVSTGGSVSGLASPSCFVSALLT